MHMSFAWECHRSYSQANTVQVKAAIPFLPSCPPPYSSQVKAAILLTLGLLITKAGAGLKPFVPQLQTTFLKCLNDPSDLVREGLG